MTELIGYAASALVAVSLLTSNVLRLRVLNLAGALVFVVYAAMAGVWPVLAVNAFIAVIDLWHIVRLKSRADIFKLMPVGPGDPLLANFLAYYARGVWQFFPEFDLKSLKDPKCVFILRNLMPVGLFIYTEESPEVRIHLDFVVEDYRDLKSARFLFNKGLHPDMFKGFSCFRATAGSEPHAGYLRRVGFTEDPPGSGMFFRPV